MLKKELNSVRFLSYKVKHVGGLSTIIVDFNADDTTLSMARSDALIVARSLFGSKVRVAHEAKGYASLPDNAEPASLGMEWAWILVGKDSRPCDLAS